MSNYVVTGGAGMIGNQLVRHLLEEGHQVAVIDDLSRGTQRNLLGLAGDIGFSVRDAVDPSGWDHAFDHLRGEVHGIFHLAARIGGVGAMYARPYDQARNIVVDHAVLEFARKLRCRLVYASSACVYPTTLQSHLLEKQIHLQEDQAWPAMPESLYGLLKLSGEEMVRAASKQMGLSVGVVRMFNAVGPEFCPIAERHVIPALLGKLLANPEQDLEVWGNGQAERSFLDARDAARALNIVMERGGSEGYPINVGDPRRYAIGDVALRCIQVVGRFPECKIRYNTSKPAGVHTRAPDLTRIKSLGWEIEHDLVDMIEWTAEVLSEA